MDSFLAVMFEGDTNEWIEALPRYQQRLVESMLTNHEPIETAIAWLGAPGPLYNEPLGAARRATNLFYDNLLSEIYSLLCREHGYEVERRNLASRAQAGKTAVVIAVSDAVAPHVGTTPVLLAPAVALTFAVIARAGKDSVCTSLAELIERRKADGQQPSSNLAA